MTLNQINYLYSVYDRLSNSYGSLVEYSCDGAAIRDFKKLYKKGVTADPSQYELHKISKVIRSTGSDSVADVKIVDVDSKSVVYTYSAYINEVIDTDVLLEKIASMDNDEMNFVTDFICSIHDDSCFVKIFNKLHYLDKSDIDLVSSFIDDLKEDVNNGSN